MTHVRVCVVKVGGSLLDTAGLPQRLRNWLASESLAHVETHFVVVTGGGKLVEAIRHVDAQTRLGDERAHWICVDLMDVTADLVAAMLPELKTVTAMETLALRLGEPGITLLRPSEFLKQCEPVSAGTRLARDWSVTSDSIAGRLAIVLGAAELVLLKSVPPPVPTDTRGVLDHWAAIKYVDAFILKLASELPPFRYANLGVGDL